MNDPLKDKDQGEYFVGYADMPGIDRRFLMGLSVLGLGAAGGLGGWLAAATMGAGRGDWDQGTTHELTGYVTADPFPMIRIPEGNGFRTVLLACQTKCGAQRQLAAADISDNRVTVRGSLIERGRHAMLAVLDGPDWIEPATGLPNRLEPFTQERLGSADLSGEILDSKCWFGAMRPNEGSVHKACATLCIASGLAPYFYVRDRMGRERAMMITDSEGQALIQPILPYVAEPVAIEGELVRISDLIQFRIDPGDIARL